MAGQTTSHKSSPRADLACPWLKRIGIAGFMFFLIKGLLWLVVPLALVFFGITE